MSFVAKDRYLLLGGAGMVGLQVAREIAGDPELDAHEIVICGVSQQEVAQALQRLRDEFKNKGFEGVAGDVFVRSDWNPATTSKNPLSRARIVGERRTPQGIAPGCIRRI
jgi:nucleoside-diphosphate-sugar epimerase